MLQNKLKVFDHLNELNGWSACWTLAHALLPLWIQSSDILVYTTTLNILKQDDYCEIYLPSLNINVWGAVVSLLVSFTCFHWLCFFWKICDFKFTQLMFSHSNDKTYPKKTFCKFVLILFPLCLFWTYVLFYFILYSINP